MISNKKLILTGKLRDSHKIKEAQIDFKWQHDVLLKEKQIIVCLVSIIAIRAFGEFCVNPTTETDH